MAPLLKQGSMSGYGDITSKDLLAFLKNDISNDICGSISISSLNYVWVMCRFFGQFMQFEDALSEVGNATYIQAYETDPGYRSHKRTGLVYLALTNNDEECLEIMAEEFERFRLGFMNHIYWTTLIVEAY
ncbi:hypothetical protein GE09DRAFT_1229844 [Coniochaeta sp. 2T2.1]|nr:hypothetical protein GE09DRAFT_1229844 [Coniochaeta sp. 2T2.1]